MLKPDSPVASALQRVLSSVLSLELPRDYWQRQGAMTALISWELPDGIAIATRWLEEAMAGQTTDGLLCNGGFIDVTSGDLPIMRRFVLSPSCTCYFVAPLLDLYHRSGNQRYLDAAERQTRAARNGPRTSDGFLLMNLVDKEIWIDEVYPVCGPLARLGTMMGRADWVDDAYHQLLVCDQRLADPATGLLRHVWAETPPHFLEPGTWSRGIGWFIGAAVDVLQATPAHREAPELRGRLLRVLRAIASRQASDGLLHDVIDDPNSPLETTGTLLFVYGVVRLFQLGHIAAGDALITAADRGLRAVAAEVEADGRVGKCSLPPGGPGVPLGPMVLGQSLFLLAVATRYTSNDGPRIPRALG